MYILAKEWMIADLYPSVSFPEEKALILVHKMQRWIVNNHSKHVRNVLHCSSPCTLKGSYPGKKSKLCYVTQNILLKS